MRIKLKYIYKLAYKRINASNDLIFDAQKNPKMTIIYSKKCATKREVIKNKRVMEFKATHDGHIKSLHKFFVKKIFNGLSFSK